MGEEKEQEEVIDHIRFVFEKARHHRTIHADGAWAGTTPHGEVQVAFFNDLRPMPDEIVHSVDEQGLLGAEQSRVHSPLDVVREANVTVVMSAANVKALMGLLERMVLQAEAITAETKSAETPSKAK